MQKMAIDMFMKVGGPPGESADSNHAEMGWDVKQNVATAYATDRLPASANPDRYSHKHFIGATAQPRCDVQGISWHRLIPSSCTRR